MYILFIYICVGRRAYVYITCVYIYICAYIFVYTHIIHLLVICRAALPDLKGVKWTSTHDLDSKCIYI